MLARTCALIGLVALAACEERKSPPPSATAVATAPSATASAPAASAATAAASATEGEPSAANPACDVAIVPAEKIGDKKLAGTAPLKVPVEAAKSYCVFGVSLTSTSTLPDVEASAPPSCKKKSLLGATHLACEGDGVTLTFAGPTGAFKEVSVYPKGAADAAKPAASK